MSMGEIIVILIVAVLVLGPEKLPDAIVQVARILKALKRQVDDARDSIEKELRVSEIKREADKFKDEMSAYNQNIRKKLSFEEFDALKKEANEIKNEITDSAKIGNLSENSSKNSALNSNENSSENLAENQNAASLQKNSEISHRSTSENFSDLKTTNAENSSENFSKNSKNETLNLGENSKTATDNFKNENPQNTQENLEKLKQAKRNEILGLDILNQNSQPKNETQNKSQNFDNLNTKTDDKNV